MLEADTFLPQILELRARGGVSSVINPEPPQI